MKKIFLLSVLGCMSLIGSFKANAQLHNMGLDMSILWPQGGFRHDFNSLYGGFFYEYRFQGQDIDVNEAIDHLGLEFGIQYTEFIFKKSNWNVGNLPNYNSYSAIVPANTSIKSSNKGFNLYVAPKYYVTLYPELLEGYAMAKIGYQYLNGKGTLGTRTAGQQLTANTNSSSVFFGGFVGLEIKLGTVFVGANFGIDSNTAYNSMKKQSFQNPFDKVNAIPKLDAFNSLDKMKSNLVLEFRVKALLNGED